MLQRRRRMSRSISLLTMVALVLLLGSMIGSSDGFQIAVPRASSTPLQKQQHLSSPLFVAARPKTTIGMSYYDEPNDNNSMESGLKDRIRNLFAAIWRFLTLPLVSAYCRVDFDYSFPSAVFWCTHTPGLQHLSTPALE
jgi:hypothetical protein